MRSTVLVIIDMQQNFSASHSHNTQDNVIRAIEYAKEQGHGIILVEYGGNGETHDVILNACLGYEKFYRVTKWTDDGSEEILSLAANIGLPLRHFVLCGVNLQACVRLTALGLADREPGCRVTVLHPACNGPDYPITDPQLLFARYNNISLEKEVEYASY